MKVYASIGAPNGHKQWHVTPDAMYQCECGVHFRRRDSLPVHWRLVSLLEYPTRTLTSDGTGRTGDV